jgi:hypothetical protein
MDNRDEFEAKYLAHMHEQWPEDNATIESIRSWRRGSGYGSDCTYLTGAWWGWQAALSRSQDVVRVADDDTRTRVRDAIAEALGDAYDCTRVWSAWGVGTMSQDDFTLVTDDDSRLDEITDAAIQAFAAPAAPAVAPHPDDEAVDQFAIALKAKLAESRAKGRRGWKHCDPAFLSASLREHVEKGDPRDVAAYCMMLWHQEQPIAAPAPAEPPEGCTLADAAMLRVANHQLAAENDYLRHRLRPFAQLASSPLSWAMVEYCIDGDPEKQTLQAPQMQRAFNRAADALREDAAPAEPKGEQQETCTCGLHDLSAKCPYGYDEKPEQRAAALTAEQIDALNFAIEYANDGGYDITAETLRELLAAHNGGSSD